MRRGVMNGNWLRKQEIVLLGVVLGLCLTARVALAGDKPAIVLAAFGTSTAAFETYKHLEAKVKERFPGYEVRWAFTSRKVRQKVAGEQGRELKDLPRTLEELKYEGITRVAVQSFHLVPGKEWEVKIIRESRAVPGMKVVIGKPLMSSRKDKARVVEALGKTFPQDLKETAVVLAGHGSPSSQGEAAYLALEQALRSRYPGRNVFFGVVEGKPTRDAALDAAKRSGASSVVFMPFLLVAGDHVDKDILGDGPDSWKSRLLKDRPLQVTGLRKGLGYNDEIVAIYLDHLDEALKSLAK